MCKNAVAAKQVIITCSSNKHYICHDVTEESDFWKSYSWVDEHSDIYSILSGCGSQGVKRHKGYFRIKILCLLLF